jgi:hypothetical protein
LLHCTLYELKWQEQHGVVFANINKLQWAKLFLKI